ncbi:MAG: hydroxylamine oxidoreductase [Phycisphaerae bacterium]|nr:hydroxylamine oxidoreductase [Phycisphaerae bacterium]NNF43654.1 hydroxylamine oxidoreductase [Phycisphaerales bacterium]
MKLVAGIVIPVAIIGIAHASHSLNGGLAPTIALSTPALAPEDPPPGGAIGLARLSDASLECIDCHRKDNPGLYQQWGGSRHYRANIGCYECHAADPDDADAFLHYDRTISVIVSPSDCARCHALQVEEFAGSHHSKAGRILGSLDNILAEVVEGNRGMVTPMFPQGNSAAAVNGCWQCHGSEVKVLEDGKLDPATWPNSGIGRINPDGSEGSCAACHQRHDFSAAQARHPDTCGKCHMGPDHPQKEIYEESKHGISFFANQHKMNLDSPKWIVGEDYHIAPTCATCHMSATPNQNVTHDVGLRISWNNRPAVSIRPEVADAKMGLPGAEIGWEERRDNMKDVCLNCHNISWVDNFYVQYDALIELYNEKFAKPGLELYALAAPLKRPVKFGSKLDFVWFEIWHHEGRRARHGVSMMGPDYTHWHGTYEVAKHFYSEFIPELEELVEKGRASGDPAKEAAAEKLHAKLEEVLNHDNHKWYLGKMTPEEAAARKQAAEEFRKRYED